ncbi:MAG: YicC/YloC family endoribonuclease [Paludibacteraceae bacterium]
MLQSMTGYGKAECLIQNQKYIIELRSLNSKQMDLSMRLAPVFREKELDIRSLLAQQLERGKADCTIYQDNSTATEQSQYTPINFEALQYYVSQLQNFAQENHLQSDILALAMRMPDVTKIQEQSTLTDEDWKTLQNGIMEAVAQFNAFRLQEGKALQEMFTEKLNTILELLLQVEPLEKERIEKIRTRLEDNLLQLSTNLQQATDRNRLEQEMIYYLEKLDITEEKVRLRNHIRYFFEVMEGEEVKGVGKKLGFVAQEMGREINTLGSKSNHSEMQIIVVKMKDVLEQIKEQVLNIL